MQGPQLLWERQLVDSAARFCEPLGGLFEAHTQLDELQAQHALFVRYGAASLEGDERLQTQLSSALVSLASTEDSWRAAQQACVSSKREVLDAHDRCLHWHQQHAQASEAIRSSWASSVAIELTNFGASIPGQDNPPVATRLQAILEGQVSGQTKGRPNSCIQLLSKHRDAEVAMLRTERLQVRTTSWLIPLTITSVSRKSF